MLKALAQRWRALSIAFAMAAVPLALVAAAYIAFPCAIQSESASISYPSGAGASEERVVRSCQSLLDYSAIGVAIFAGIPLVLTLFGTIAALLGKRTLAAMTGVMVVYFGAVMSILSFGAFPMYFLPAAACLCISGALHDRAATLTMGLTEDRRRTRAWGVVVLGLILGAVIPLWFLTSGAVGRMGGWGAWSTYDLIARVALFSAPLILASLALLRRPALFAAAAAATIVALPLTIIAVPMFGAAALWLVVFDRRRPRMDARRTIGVIVATCAVLAAGGVFFFAPSPLVCTKEIRYADGTVRRSVKIQGDSGRSWGSATSSPTGKVRSTEHSCSTSVFLPERSLTVLGLLVSGTVTGFLLTSQREVEE